MTTHHNLGKRRIVAAVIGAAFLAAFLAGCNGAATTPAAGGGSSNTSASSSGAATSIDVSLTEWSVKASAASAKAGELKFVVANKGAIPREFVVVKSDLAEASLSQANAAVDEKQIPPIGRTANIDPGKSETKSFTLQPGKYVLLCNIPAHYGQGMHLAFTVQ